MRRFRTAAAVILVVAMACALAVAPAGATKFGDTAGVPAGYWAVQGAYDDALAAKDNAAIIAAGEKILSFWFGSKTAQQCADEWSKNVLDHGWEINQVWSVCDKIAPLYEARDDLTNSIRLYKIAMAFVDPYIALMKSEPKLNGDPADMEFARQKIQAKLDAYDVSVSVYAEIDAKYGVGDTSFTGAINEPKTGIYYGETAGQYAVMDLAKKPSSTIIYVSYETENMAKRVENDLAENEKLNYDRKDYSVIEVAWNFSNEGETLGSVPNDKDKVTEAAKYLKELGLPILLRVGAEMNVWNKAADPAQFKAAFRFIADIVHKEAPNVAMVWSVNYISAQGMTYEMFYPGAEYVDWVGISLYTVRYFQGNPNTTSDTAALYGTGQFGNPVRYIASLVEMYGSKHPIMIAEGAVTIRNISNNEDVTNWALPRIRQTYAYIPMLFPQVKAVIWFNKVDTRSDFSFSSNKTVHDLYGQLTSSGYFLGKGAAEPSITYKKLGTASFPASSVTLLTYAPYITMDDISVQYQLDGKWVGQSSVIPYRSALNLSGEANGAHKLTVRVSSGGNLLKSIDYNLYKKGDTVVVSAGTITPPNVSPSPSKVFVDGKQVTVEAYLHDNGSNYLKLRDMAMVLNGTAKQFEVGYSSATGVTMESGKAYTPNGTEGQAATLAKTASGAGDPVFKDGQSADVNSIKIEGSNYYGLRDMCKLLNVDLVYDSATKDIKIDTTKPYTAP